VKCEVLIRLDCLVLVFGFVIARARSVVTRTRARSPAMSQFLRQLGSLKVKEVPKFLQDKVTVANVTNHTQKFLAEYKVKYIDAGSPMPIYHVMAGVFVTAYITVWPTEYRHMMAAKNGHH
tara:strand:- start:662 stop:1024 length:363 start_codon:yes stop_codon:yes gene_type:complete